MASGRGIVLAKDRSLLYENGGQIQISKSWADSLLKRMGIVNWKGIYTCIYELCINTRNVKVGFHYVYSSCTQETGSKHVIKFDVNEISDVLYHWLILSRKFL